MIKLKPKHPIGHDESLLVTPLTDWSESKLR